MDRFQTAGRRMAILAAITIALAFAAPAASFAEADGRPKRQENSPSEAMRLGDYLAARTAQLDHDWRTAGPLMHRAWEADRENPQLRHDALLLSIAGGDFADALEIAHTIRPDTTDAALADFVLTIDDLTEGRFGAIDARLAGASHGLDRYLRPLVAAWAEAGRGHKDQALAALAPLDDIQGAGELKSLQGAMIAEAFGDKARATAFYRALLEGKPSVRALNAAAEFYQRQGDIDQARAAAEQIDPDGSSASLRIELLARVADKRKAAPPPTVRSGVADALFELAASLSADEHADIAPLLYIELALHLTPNFPSAQLLRADLDQRWGRMAESAATLLAIDDKSVLASTAERLAMGALNRADDSDKALATGRAAVAAHPEDIDLALSYADLLRIKSHYAEAIAAYDSALERMPATSARRGVALYHRGIAYQQAHEWPRAETDLLAALQLRPEDPGLLNYLAFSWADQGINLDRARTMLERAVQLVPDDGAIVDSLGWVMYRSGDYDEAVKQLERAVSLDAGDATINDHLGDAYWRSGRQLEARSQWERAERLSDDKALTEQIRAKLRDGLNGANPPRRAAAD